MKKNYFKLTPQKKVVSGYITWTDNFNFEFKGNKWKIWLHFIPFLRWLFNKPINFDKRISKIKKKLFNLSQQNPDRYWEIRDKILPY